MGFLEELDKLAPPTTPAGGSFFEQLNAIAPPKKIGREDVAFDPEGEDYDYTTARLSGARADAEGHWPSKDPVTGMLLKGRRHPTFHKTLEGEAAQGYRVEKRGNRYFSFPAAGPANFELDIAALGPIDRSIGEAMVESYGRGARQAVLDQLWFDVKAGLRNEGEVRGMQAEYDRLVAQDPIKAKNWLVQQFYATAQMLPAMLKGWEEGVLLGSSLGLAAGVAAGPREGEHCRLMVRRAP